MTVLLSDRDANILKYDGVEPTENLKRAKRALVGLRAYSDDDANGVEEAISDMLTDLKHLARLGRGVLYDRAEERANGNFEDELTIRMDLSIESLGMDPRQLNMPVDLPQSDRLEVHTDEKDYSGNQLKVAGEMASDGWSVNLA